MILVGEMRDLETISTALTAAETGHLVFATLHTQSAPQTIDRVIDAFPAAQQGQIRVQLAATLQGVVTQNLIPTADGRGRVAALEILDPRRRSPEPDPAGEDRADLLGHADQHRRAGCMTMEQSLADLVQRRVISTEIAFSRSSRPDQLAASSSAPAFTDVKDFSIAAAVPAAGLPMSAFDWQVRTNTWT